MNNDDKQESVTHWSRRRLVGPLEKGLAVLGALTERSGVQGRTLTEVSELVGMNMSTTLRILNTLVEWGYVRRVNDRYMLGLRVLALSKAVTETLEVRREARPLLEELCRDAEQTCHLGVLDRNEIVYIDKVEPSRPFQMRSRIGDRMPVHATALGKVMLAFSSPAIVASILAQPLTAQTPRTVVDPQELRQQLEEIRLLGYALDNEENEEGVMCLGAPIFDHRGDLIAAVSVSGPAFTMAGEALPEIGEKLRRAGLSISMRLGYSPQLAAAQQWFQAKEAR
jgi:IclR family transcriptional regulator, KDG regulon repressor